MVLGLGDFMNMRSWHLSICMADFEYMIASDKRRIANCKQKSRIGKNVVIKTRIIVRYRIWFVIMSDNKKTENRVVPLYMKREQTIRIRVILYFHQFWDVSKHKQTGRKRGNRGLLIN